MVYEFGILYSAPSQYFHTFQVDGPSHYCANSRRTLGYHTLKDRLVRQQGW